MGKEIITVTKQELVNIDEHTKKIENQNYKLVALRKKQVYEMLRDATVRRIETSKNISHWITMLSDKIFNPKTIDEMDLNKAIALFKYINNINLKVLSESNRLEEILGKYIESGVMDTAAKMGNTEVSNQRDQIKHEILSKLNKMFKDSSEEVDVVEVESTPGLTDEERVELDAAEKRLEDNLAAIDDEIDLDINLDLDDELD